MKIYFCIVTSLKSHHEINTRKRTSSFHLDFWLPKSRIPPNEGLKVMWLKFLLSTNSTPVKNLRSKFPIQCKIGIIERITCKWTFTHKFWPNLRARIEIHQTDNIVNLLFLFLDDHDVLLAFDRFAIALRFLFNIICLFINSIFSMGKSPKTQNSLQDRQSFQKHKTMVAKTLQQILHSYQCV